MRVLGDIGANIRSGFGKGFTNPADLRKIHQVPAPFLFFLCGKTPRMHDPPVEGQAHFRVPPVQTIGPLG